MAVSRGRVLSVVALEEDGVMAVSRGRVLSVVALEEDGVMAVSRGRVLSVVALEEDGVMKVSLSWFMYLATGASFRSLAFSFRMSHTTIRQVVYETCEAIWNTLYQKHMPFPTESMFSSIAEQFYRKLELNVLRNLGLVDAQYKFICVEVGSYGKQSDGGIFTTSSLYHHLEQNTFCVPGPKTVPGTNIIVPHVFVGDAAYPLKQYLMRPFSGHNLSQEQENFNYCLSRARRLVECAFGIITSKWRILKTEIELAPDKVDLIVKCICLLHNIIIDLEGNPHIIKDIVNLQRICDRNVGTRNFNRATTTAYDIRNQFMQYFNNH
ncbi:hypothetical protein PPYR_15401 [Photinus pyralis]|uniref:DDE Tnp4 domain-containing protein n=2 Tax=Photinus pyralis TaxID=7054 RepID=A0A5N3ZYX0_PHOPY|nr:hypothetical protein PPYR_15401 [Photinus pyralis]